VGSASRGPRVAGYLDTLGAMTIREVRLNLKAADRAVTRQLNRAHWGFTYWFDSRLKSIRPQLRGDEVKGINILIFDFRSLGLQGFTPAREWKQLLNTINYANEIDTVALLHSEPIPNIQMLMQLASTACHDAPWPQVRCLEPVLRTRLSETESTQLEQHLARWHKFVCEPSGA